MNDGLRKHLREHYLAGIECDHGAKRDRPLCACASLDLGWHPNVGAAVDAWIAHVAASRAGELSRSHQTERLRLERRLTEAEAIVRWFVDEYRPNKYVAPSVKDWYERARSFLNASVAPVVASGPAGDTEGGS